MKGAHAVMTPEELAIYSVLSVMAGRNVIAMAREVRLRAWASAEVLEGFRVERLRKLVTHAAATVPHYQRVFAECGFAPGDLRSTADLSGLPVLTRGQVISSFAQLRSTTARDSEVIRRSTGGTTGEPVTVLLDRSAWLERMLVNHRMMALMGRSLGKATLLIAGSPVDSVLWTSLREAAKNRLFNVTVRSSFGLTPRGLDDITDLIRSGRYEFVLAYASVFDMLALRCRERGAALPIRNIIPAAELVTAAQRASWQEAFGCQTFEIYGSRELTSVAGELPDHDQLAVNSDFFCVESVDDDGKPVPDGTPGLLTFTALPEMSMPLIRYQLGDVGSLHPPPTGSPHPFPRLTITHGRVLDVIRCPDGKLLPGEFFPHLIKEVQSAVSRYQVVQEDIRTLRLRIVPTAAWSGDTRAYLSSRIRAQVGTEMEIVFETVESIATSPSGKYRPTISHVR